MNVDPMRESAPVNFGRRANVADLLVDDIFIVCVLYFYCGFLISV